MFPNLKAEMARMGLTVSYIANKIEVEKTWLENRLNGKCVLPIETAFSIWEKCFSSMSIQYLFAHTAIIPFDTNQLPKTENEKSE